MKMLNESYTLFDSCSSREGCQDQLVFSSVLPTHFKHNDKEFPLPPSYHQHLDGISTLMVRSLYNVHFSITRIRHKKLDIFPKTKQYVPDRPLNIILRSSINGLVLVQHLCTFPICASYTSPQTDRPPTMFLLFSQDIARGMVSGSHHAQVQTQHRD